jgi:hypothetical protein
VLHYVRVAERSAAPAFSLIEYWPMFDPVEVILMEATMGREKHVIILS